MKYAHLGNESIVFLAAILLSSILLPVLVPLYKRFDLVDRPNARSTHSRAVPRGVGLVVVLAFWAVFITYSLIARDVPFREGGKLWCILAASALLVFTGFVDDARGVRAGVKLVVQFAAAALVIVAGFVTPLPEVFGAAQSWIEYAVTLFWIVGVINSVNFIDGSDGLCTSVCSVCMLVFVGLSWLLYSEDPTRTTALAQNIHLLGFAATGSALPFLLYNHSPAKCFLGDAGSMFFGFVLGLLGILITQYAEPTGDPAPFSSYRLLIVPWLVLVVPIGDSIRVASWRLIRHRSPFRPDNTHLHHLLRRAGLSPNQMVFYVGILTVLSSLVATFVAQPSPSPYLLVGIGILFVLGQLWFLRTSKRVLRFFTHLMSKSLLHSNDIPQGFENASVFKERLEQELARARRWTKPLSVSVVMIAGKEDPEPGINPLENPKFIEDLLETLRREDVKAQLTPERLAFLLVETEKTAAQNVMERIHDLFVSIRRGDSADLCFGIGHAAFPEDGDSSQNLLNLADSQARKELRGQRLGGGDREDMEDGPGDEDSEDRRGRRREEQEEDGGARAASPSALGGVGKPS